MFSYERWFKMFNFISKISPPHTRVLEWIRDLTGVGADIDKGSQSTNGIWEDFVQEVIYNKLVRILIVLIIKLNPAIKIPVESKLRINPSPILLVIITNLPLYLTSQFQ